MGPLRLQCRLPPLLPLFEAAMVPHKVAVVLHKQKQGLPEQHASVMWILSPSRRLLCVQMCMEAGAQSCSGAAQTRTRAARATRLRDVDIITVAPAALCAGVHGGRRLGLSLPHLPMHMLACL